MEAHTPSSGPQDERNVDIRTLSNEQLFDIARKVQWETVKFQRGLTGLLRERICKIVPEGILSEKRIGEIAQTLCVESFMEQRKGL